MRRWAFRLFAVALNILAFTAGANASVLTFELPGIISLPVGSSYVENGMNITAYVHPATVGNDPLHPSGDGPSGGQFYMGANYVNDQYAEFKMTNNSTFTLNSFDLMTNGSAGRWISTSANPTQQFIFGVVTSYDDASTLDHLTFAESSFSNITWFKIGTNAAATQIDNLNYTSTSPVPIPSTAWLLGSALIGLVSARRGKKA